MRKTVGTNAIDAATTTSKNWGFVPVPGKGGVTTNAEIPRKDAEDMTKGGKNHA